MALYPSYLTGTIAIAVNATTAFGTGVSWSPVNARGGDTLIVAGHEVGIYDTNGVDQLTIDAWPFAAVVAGTAYKIRQNSTLRVVGAQANADVTTMLQTLSSYGPVYNVPSIALVPDPSYGLDNQYAYQMSTDTWWIKTGGLWVLTLSPSSGSILTQFRLTLASGIPVTETGAITNQIYYTPNGGERLEAYNGTRFVSLPSAELSMLLDATAGHTGYHQAGKNFFLGVFLNTSGGITMGSSVAWSGDNTIGVGAGSCETEIWKGRLVNKYDMTVRYSNGAGNTTLILARQFNIIGGFRTCLDGLTSDGFLQRFLSNLYNAEDRQMRVIEATATWTAPVASGLHQVRGQTSNKVEWFVCCSGRILQAKAMGQTQTTQYYEINIGLNSVTLGAQNALVAKNNNIAYLPAVAFLEDYPGIGYGYAAWLEKAYITDCVGVGAGVNGLYAKIKN